MKSIDEHQATNQPATQMEEEENTEDENLRLQNAKTDL